MSQDWNFNGWEKEGYPDNLTYNIQLTITNIQDQMTSPAFWVCSDSIGGNLYVWIPWMNATYALFIDVGHHTKW